MLSMALLDEPLSRYSVSIQSMNQWLLIRFRGVTMLFLFVVTSSLALWGLCAPAWQRHHLLRWRKREMGRQELGEGDHREGLSRLFLVVPCCIAFRCAVVCIRKCKHLCCHVSIFVWPCDGKEICSKGAQFVKYVSAKSVCVWFKMKPDNFFLCMSIPGCFCYYQSLLFSCLSALFRREIGKWKNMTEKKDICKWWRLQSFQVFIILEKKNQVKITSCPVFDSQFNGESKLEAKLNESSSLFLCKSST